jgi:hypothetical protein
MQCPWSILCSPTAVLRDMTPGPLGYAVTSLIPAIFVIWPIKVPPTPTLSYAIVEISHIGKVRQTFAAKQRSVDCLHGNE